MPGHPGRLHRFSPIPTEFKTKLLTNSFYPQGFFLNAWLMLSYFYWYFNLFFKKILLNIILKGKYAAVFVVKADILKHFPYWE